MTDKKFTDDEIIKDLKQCEGCHYYGECEKSVRKALDLINRLKEEIERLTALINELVEANEDFVRDTHDLYVSLKKRDAEIERLKEFEHTYNDLCK